MRTFAVNQNLSLFYAPNSDFYSEMQELTQILLRISEEKFGGWSLWTAGRFGVHLVREISPWSSQVLCIGLVKT